MLILTLGKLGPDKISLREIKRERQRDRERENSKPVVPNRFSGIPYYIISKILMPTSKI